MRSARDFLLRVRQEGRLQHIRRLHTHLYGSLALTGKGHATDRAVLLGLCGETPDAVDIDSIEARLEQISSRKSLALLGEHEIEYDPVWDIEFHFDETMPGHPNGMRFVATDGEANVIAQQGYYSVGGGAYVLDGGEQELSAPPKVMHPFHSADDLLRCGDETGLPIWRIGWENELAWHREEEIRAWVDRIWKVMRDCVQRGLQAEGMLPGGLQVGRRAPNLSRALLRSTQQDPLSPLDWVDSFAMAVNEENAAGGRVVTAPTNGSAGIIPAVAHFYQRFVRGANSAGLERFFLTSAVIGVLYKENASISGADVGCQGEVGVASSMAAGGLVAAIGGSNHCVEKAAEMAMEHHLGMTCDPVAGLVQIPCIERNAMGAVTAINSCRISMREGREHKVSLDKVMQTMLQTGQDMRATYKETSQGGLAANVIFC